MHIRTRQLQNQCKIYSILQIKTANYNKLIDVLVVIITLFITSVSGTFLTINHEKYKNENIGIGIVLFLSTFLTSIREYFNLKELSNNNKIYSRKFEILNNKIAVQYYKKIKKEDVIKFADELNDLILKQPSINFFISFYYLKKIKEDTFIPGSGFTFSDKSSDSSNEEANKREDNKYEETIIL